MQQLDQQYWETRYQNGLTGWDAGAITTPLREYFDQLTDKSVSVLIPGAGNAHEAAYLFELGFSDVHVLDISESALRQFQLRNPLFPKSHIHQGDFWAHEGKYDLIIEQTFFCAIDPVLRTAYVKKTSDILRSGGKLVGVLWNHPMGENEPPFGGSEAEYIELFSECLEINVLETAYNSIQPRAGREVFIKMTKK
ncbi:methyltransferase domain-containing protein [Marinoscillum luteum]|uniref:Methyltransferase domain-containing protein n=1 Tax=Marinoscillum luteum TaxID=861051 RepID=A0ABW7NCY9_9BACT